VLIFTVDFVAPDAATLFGAGSALGTALPLDFLAGVPVGVLASDFWPLLAVFFAAGLVVLPVLLAAAGVGDGVAWAWLLALGFCAVATVAKAVASARICISFISIPFLCTLHTETLYGFAVGDGTG
jgi:hypothetical protein